ncbi:MAG: M12 family metallopeptidase [Myxococcota bacterium]|nr:M12 family metallopeptidase [Myxococcota bacterium]
MTHPTRFQTRDSWRSRRARTTPLGAALLSLFLVLPPTGPAKAAPGDDLLRDDSKVVEESLSKEKEALVATKPFEKLTIEKASPEKSLAEEPPKLSSKLREDVFEAELKRDVEVKTSLDGWTSSETFATPYGDVTLTYERIGGRTVVEGDILVDLDDLREQAATDSVEYGTQPGDSPGEGYGSTSSGLAAVRRSEKLWPGAVVPYWIDPSLPNQIRVERAIDHWEMFTPLRFVERTNEDDFVAFVPHDELCASHIGRKGGRQEIVLADDCSRGTVIHEIAHAVGVFHEQSREDRDDHVVIHWGEIESGKGHNFKKYSDDVFLWWGGQDGQDMGPYDFASIMHYGSMFFAKNGSPTITRRNNCSGAGCLIVPQRTALSRNDTRYLHELYCPLVGWDPNRCSNYLEPAEGPTYQIVNRNYGQEECLDVANASLAAGTAVNEFPCHGGNNQMWQVQPDPDGTGTFFIRNKNSGQCLDVPNASTGFVGVNQFPCNGADNQRFTLYHNPSPQPYQWASRRHGRFSLRPLHSGMCLGINGQGRLQQTSCSSSVARIFEFQVREFPFSSWSVVNDDANWCLDIPSSSTADVPVQHYPCHGGENQEVSFVPRVNGSFAMRMAHSDRCLGLRSGDLVQVDCGTPDAPNYGTGFFLHLMGDTVQLRGDSPRVCVGVGGVSTDVDTATCSWNHDERYRLERR